MSECHFKNDIIYFAKILTYPTPNLAFIFQVTPVPSSELAKQGYPTSNSQQPKLQSVSSMQGVQTTPTLPRTVQSIVSSPTIQRPTIIQQVVTKPVQPTGLNPQAGSVRPQSRIIQQIVRPGQILPNGQQVIIQNGKPVFINAPAAAATLPQGKIVLTQKGQVLQGAQAAALAGKIINTPQGQFIMGPNGQLLSTQKLIQNHLTNQNVRYVTVQQSGVSATKAGSVITTTAAGTLGPATTSAVGSPGQKVMVAIPLPAGLSQAQLQQVVRQQQLRQAAAVSSPLGQLSAARQTVLSPQGAGARSPGTAGVRQGTPQLATVRLSSPSPQVAIQSNLQINSISNLSVSKNVNL